MVRKETNKPSTSVRYPKRIKIYAELYGNIKKLGIKNPSDNKMDEAKKYANSIVDTIDPAATRIQEVTNELDNIKLGVDATIGNSIDPDMLKLGE